MRGVRYEGGGEGGQVVGGHDGLAGKGQQRQALVQEGLPRRRRIDNRIVLWSVIISLVISFHFFCVLNLAAAICKRFLSGVVIGSCA
jgi:hypothetical protein